LEPTNRDENPRTTPDIPCGPETPPQRPLGGVSERAIMNQTAIGRFRCSGCIGSIFALLLPEFIFRCEALILPGLLGPWPATNLFFEVKSVKVLKVLIEAILP